jgi:hypothetical protein
MSLRDLQVSDEKNVKNVSGKTINSCYAIISHEQCMSNPAHQPLKQQQRHRTAFLSGIIRLHTYTPSLIHESLHSFIHTIPSNHTIHAGRSNRVSEPSKQASILPSIHPYIYRFSVEAPSHQPAPPNTFEEKERKSHHPHKPRHEVRNQGRKCVHTPSSAR